jgi:hypothetical protein
MTKFTADKANFAKHDTETNIATIVDGHAVYPPERQQMHDAILNHFLDKAAEPPPVPAEGKALMSGGMGGSGKGTILGGHEPAGIPALINENEWLTVDPDEVKKQMLLMGMGPDIPGLQPMETAFYIHEESSHIAKMLTRAAADRKLNTILDTTMATEDSTRKRAQTMIDAGYSLEAVFADVPVSVTKESATKRYENGARVFQATGQGLGGRFVPVGYLDESAPEPGSPYDSKNRQTLENLRQEGMFTRVRVFDNSDRGQPPRMVYDWTHPDGFVVGGN